MRLWTLHPKYLDARGLVALWREALLAQKVLQGGTRGYVHHPQLERFRTAPDPEAAIAAYLLAIVQEAERRGYSFDVHKIGNGPFPPGLIDATEGQLLYEWRHLKQKLRQRVRSRYEGFSREAVPEQHPIFRLVPGGVQEWERVK